PSWASVRDRTPSSRPSAREEDNLPGLPCVVPTTLLQDEAAPVRSLAITLLEKVVQVVSVVQSVNGLNSLSVLNLLWSSTASLSLKVLPVLRGSRDHQRTKARLVHKPKPYRRSVENLPPRRGG